MTKKSQKKESLQTKKRLSKKKKETVKEGTVKPVTWSIRNLIYRIRNWFKR